MHHSSFRLPFPSTRDISLEKLIYLEAIRNYTCLYFLDGKQEVYGKTLRLFEECLPSQHFVRIHRSYLVRRDYIHTYNNNTEITLKNGLKLKVARRRKYSIVPNGNYTISQDK
ncbi:MAG: LytR/AlgR family response regulator transcription factor [Runella zeae]